MIFKIILSAICCLFLLDYVVAYINDRIIYKIIPNEDKLDEDIDGVMYSLCIITIIILNL